MFGSKDKKAQVTLAPLDDMVDIGISDEDINGIEDDSTFDYNENQQNNEIDSNKKDNTNEDAKDLILYIIIDRLNPSLLQYYRECGINVSKIFTNINDAKDTLLMQIEPVKVLIIDTGTGRFSAMGSRKELLDLMGICDEDTRISVYYTDTVIKSEVEYNEGFAERNIRWHKFKSNADVVAHLLKNKGKENYTYDKEDKDKITEVPQDLLNFVGFKFKEGKQLNLGEPSITSRDIIIHRGENCNEDNLIEGFNITKI